ncbi:MAG TPA: hypothetical protein VD707_06905 [Gemmatimonadales bacterium]|nr:hypothetical protein [Gemmatimonadales bacterium]
MSRRPAVLALTAALGAALPLAAQDSQFGVSSLGTPARQESVRARGTGGAFTLFDEMSPLAEAQLADLERGTFGAHTQVSRRTVAFASGESFELKDTRFPVLVAAGRTPWKIRIATGFATYIDRSYVVTRRDSVALRGRMEPYSDEHKSDGNVGDIRLALAGRPLKALAVGGALHLITGSTQEEVRRRWDDSVTYRNTFELEDVQYTGLGGSLSALLDVSRTLRVAGWGRLDTRLKTKARGQTVDSTDLPAQVAGAVEWHPRGALRVAAAVRWAGWSVAPGGHDTFGWSIGAEAGSPSLPVRLGVRRDLMAFGPGPDAPTELGLTAGVARQFSDGRARIELAIERIIRSGPGLDERLWTLDVGLVVRP